MKTIVFAILLFATVLLPPYTAVAEDTPPPAPLETETAGEFIAFDLYVGGNYFGIVYGSFGDTWFEASTPRDILTLLPDVKDPNAFLPLFTGRIEGSKELQTIGSVSVDTENFRLALHVAPEQSLLTKTSLLDDLPDTDRSFALQNRTTATASTSFSHLLNVDDATLSHDTLLSFGRSYFQTEGSLSNNAGYELTAAAVRHDFSAYEHDLSGSAGVLQSRGLRFARSLDFFGARVESNSYLLFRDPLLQASQLEVFLPSRARVEVFRNSASSGRLLLSTMMDFGTKQIDTRSFPSGSYDVEIVVTEDNGAVSRETRPFTKTRGLSPIGKPEINLEIGQVRDKLDTVDSLLALASYRTRTKDWLGSQLSLAVTSDDMVMEAELNTEMHTQLAETHFFVTTGWFGAVDDRLSPAGLGAELSVTDSDNRSLTLLLNKTFDRSTAALDPGDLSLSERESLNTSLSTPIEIFGRNGRATLNGEWSESATGGSAYRYGPSLTLPLLQSPLWSVDTEVELMKTDSDTRALLSFTLDKITGAWKSSSEMVMRSIGSEKSLSASSSLGFNGEASEHKDWRRETNANLSLRFDPLTSNEADHTAIMDGDIDYRGEWMYATGFANANMTQGTDRIGGALASTVLWTQEGGLKASPESPSYSSALLGVRLLGKPGIPIGIAVDGSPRAYGRTGETLYLNLPIYKTSTITAFDASEEEGEEDAAVAVQESGYSLTAFPGNVFFKEFHVHPLVIVIGQLADFNGAPMSYARMEVNEEIIYTEEDGFFTLETPYFENHTITILTEQQTCTIPLPEMEEGEVLVDAGTVTCQKR